MSDEKRVTLTTRSGGRKYVDKDGKPIKSPEKVKVKEEKAHD